VGSTNVPATVRMTQQMRRVEEEQGEPVEALLRRLHWHEGWTVQELSERIGVPASTLHGWLDRFGLTRRALAERAAQEEQPQ
jgi:DNA-directed RNA polymerase specialized sigma24 family protein